MIDVQAQALKTILKELGAIQERIDELCRMVDGLIALQQGDDVIIIYSKPNE